jgi:hypothetical protein
MFCPGGLFGAAGAALDRLASRVGGREYVDLDQLDSLGYAQKR